MPETEYQGLPIRKHSLAIRGAGGDALSGVLKVKPQDFHVGTPVYILVEAMPGPVHHAPMNEGDAWELVQITKAVRGTIIDAKTALPFLDETTIALEDLRIAETGQGRLDLDTKMTDDHLAGLHKRRRKACPLCQETSDEAVAHADELAAKRAEHGDGEGDAENPLPAARKYRTGRPRKAAAAKKGGKRTPAKP